MHGCSYPIVLRVLILFVLEQYKIENLFEVVRTTEVSLWCDINEEFDLQKIIRWVLLLRFSSFVCKIGTLS